MLIMTMFPDDFEKDDKFAAVLPVASVEQHGPHLLLGCDGYIAYALARMVAEKTGAVLYPPLPFSWIGGLRPYAGTIDMRPHTTGEYMEKTGLAILNQGFSRLILINCHGGGRDKVYSVARRIFKKTGKPVVTLYPTNIYRNWPEIVDIWKRHGMEFEWAAIEAAELAGALRYLGKDELSMKVLSKTAEAVDEFGETPYIAVTPGLDSAFKLSEVGHDYTHECMHVQPRKNINPEAAIEALRFMAEKIAESAKAI